jgi:sugar phosphate isomerase/epimerase
MYAQQDRFNDGAAFARYAAEAGYDAIEISHSTRAPKFEEIFASGVLPISSVHAAAPWTRLPDGRGNSRLNLASVDDEERSLAVAHTIASIGWAVRVGATKVVVHLGHLEVGGDLSPEEYRMRRLFDGGEPFSPEFAEKRLAAIHERTSRIEPHLAAARKSLLELVEAARPHAIAIGAENRYHYHEIPHPAEYDVVLDGLGPDEAGYWHDTGHAEVLHRLGFIDRHAWLDHLSSRCIGAHLHDVEGIGDHRAPGDGDVEWDYIVGGLFHLDRYTLEINQHQPDERVLAAPGFLRSAGL